MGEHYGLEREYEQGKLSPEQIRGCRQSLKTKEIIGRLRSKLDVMLSTEHPPRGELMEKALRYFHTFWKQLFVYLNDGRYDIDNTEAERKMRPLTISCKNTLFFDSEEGVEVTTTNYTFIAACKLNGLAPLDYLTHVFRQLMKGNKDYESLLHGK